MMVLWSSKFNEFWKTLKVFDRDARGGVTEKFPSTSCYLEVSAPYCFESSRLGKIDFCPRHSVCERGLATARKECLLIVITKLKHPGQFFSGLREGMLLSVRKQAPTVVA